MSEREKVSNRIIGIDIHPRCFAAAALTVNKKQLWLHSRVEMSDLDHWFKKHIYAGDLLVLESGSNSFAFAEKFIELVDVFQGVDMLYLLNEDDLSLNSGGEVAKLRHNRKVSDPECALS